MRFQGFASYRQILALLASLLFGLGVVGYLTAVGVYGYKTNHCILDNSVNSKSFQNNYQVVRDQNGCIIHLIAPDQ